MKLKEKQRLRCLVLANYLETLPRNYRHFKMETFFRGKSSDDGNALEAKYAKENGGVGHCGTSACAVGHGPSAGIYVPDSMIEFTPTTYHTGGGYHSVNWNDYAKLFVGNFNGDDPEHHERSILFEWMFGGGWRKCDQHHWGAAARIRFVLAGNEIPEGFRDADDHATRGLKRHYRPYDKRYMETV